jgi:acetoin:2,6-dichlorophenolindophenol oxidoreductase subunit alpha
MSAELLGELTASYEDQSADQLHLRLYARMTLIRSFERKLQELFSRGRLPGFVHLYVGEEAVAVGACSVLRTDDKITSTHRGHGHLIAKGADPHKMMAEIMGKKTGLCRGKGGSMHIADYSLGILGANGIVGGGIPIATGSALADRTLGRDRVTVCFFGDGAANQGVLLEALNLSSIWQLPVVFVCENNGYTEWMRTADITAGQIAERARPFGIPSAAVDGNDVLAVRESIGLAVSRARSGGGPSLIEARTYRMLAHNEGEEAFSGVYRPAEEIARWQERDPLDRFAAWLADQAGPDRSVLEEITQAARDEVESAVQYATASPDPEPPDALTDLYAQAGAR